MREHTQALAHALRRELGEDEAADLIEREHPATREREEHRAISRGNRRKMLSRLTTFLLSRPRSCRRKGRPRGGGFRKRRGQTVPGAITRPLVRRGVRDSRPTLDHAWRGA
jgi:hypothetical protein